MEFSELYDQFVSQLYQTSWLEATAVVFGIISVVLANRNHVLLYPAGIISTSIYIYILATIGLYAEALLNGYYFVMSIYGWIRWNTYQESMSTTAITHNDRKDWMITILIVGVGFTIMYFTLNNFTDSDVPVIDAVVAAFAWAGMWLLAKHKIENWVLLNVSNAIAIPLFIYKGIPMTALLTVVLFIVAVSGYFRWRKLYRQQLQNFKR